jgi:integrase
MAGAIRAMSGSWDRFLAGFDRDQSERDERESQDSRRPSGEDPIFEEVDAIYWTRRDSSYSTSRNRRASSSACRSTSRFRCSAPVASIRYSRRLWPTSSQTSSRRGRLLGRSRRRSRLSRWFLDHARISPNPARDRVVVKLPREEPEEINPPTAEHVTAVFRRLPRKHRLALLFLDWSGARVAAIDLTRVGDYDEPGRRVRLRASTTKTRRALWVELPDVLADAIEATLPHRRFRDPDARLFAESGADALRTSIAKACKAEGVPVFWPHDLRHRRISLLHARGKSWAQIGALVGQRDLSVTANTYSHVLMDETEVEYAALLAV